MAPPQGGTRSGDPAALARDLQAKLLELQRAGRELDGAWRMQLVRQGGGKADVWRRCGWRQTGWVWGALLRRDNQPGLCCVLIATTNTNSTNHHPHALPIASKHQHKQTRRVEAVAEEADVLARGLERFGGREARRRREAAEREELLASAELGRRLKGEMDEEAAVAGHVTRSRRALAEMHEQGGAILATMAGSRERIKAAQKKMLDVINSVGLGESVLRVIERRHKGDAYVAFGGMALVGLLTVALLWWAWA